MGKNQELAANGGGTCLKKKKMNKSFIKLYAKTVSNGAPKLELLRRAVG